MEPPAPSEIRFRSPDAVFLWCIPPAGGPLPYVVWLYTFTNRCAPPTHAELEGFFSRALTAGAITLSGERVTVTDLWYRRVHDADDTTPNEIESILACEEWLYAQTWDGKAEGEFVPSRVEYEAAIRRPE